MKIHLSMCKAYDAFGLKSNVRGGIEKLLSSEEKDEILQYRELLAHKIKK